MNTNNIKIKEAFDSLFEELQSLCDDNHILLRYYYNTELNSYNLRFEKCNKAFRYSISETDLIYKRKAIILSEINSKLIELYDSIRNSIH